METHSQKLQTRLQSFPIQQDDKTASGGAILAIHFDAYATIEPIAVPTPYQPYIAIALLQPVVGTKLITIEAYLSQPTTAQGKLEYQAILHWLTKLLNEEYGRRPPRDPPPEP